MFKTLKLTIFFSTLILTAMLTGCSNDNLDLDKDVSSIEVYQYDEDTLIDTIKDEEFIDKLVRELDEAATKTTANMDFKSPDYELVFKSAEDKEIFNIGYFKEVMDLGVKGRYWEGDLMYKAELALPID